MYSQAKADNSASSRLSDSILSKLSIGEGRIPSAPKIVLAHNDEFRNVVAADVNGKVAQAQNRLAAEINSRVSLLEKPGFEQDNEDAPSRAEVMRIRDLSIPAEAYSGIDASGNVGVWYGEAGIPKGAAVLFIAKQHGVGWEIEPVPSPDLSAPYFSAIKQADRNCALSEQTALNATRLLSIAEPKPGFDLSPLDRRTRAKVEALSEGERLGTLPAVFVNYVNGEALPLELYVSKRLVEPANEAGIFVLASRDKEQIYSVVDPITGLYSEGKTLMQAIQNLSQSGFYPPGAIFCQSASNGFNSRFEKAGVVSASTVVKSWEGKADAVAGGMGWFSMGCMMAAPESGGITGGVGVATGIPAMGWFTYRAIEHFVQKYEHKKEFFDPTKPEDWREAGMLLASIMTRGKGAGIARLTGLGLMTAADVWDFADQFSELKKDKGAMSEFFLKRGGQLAASLAMNIYFGGKEVRGWKAAKLQTAESAERRATEKQAQAERETGRPVPTSLTARGEELAGARRLLLELETSPAKAKQCEAQYTELVSKIAQKLRDDLGITPNEEKRFIEGAWEVMTKSLNMEYVNDSRFLHEALSTNQWNCDLLSTLMFDVAREMEMHATIAIVPGHALITTSKFYFDPSIGEYGTIAALAYKYPIIEQVSADPRAVQSLTHLKLGLEADLAGDYDNALRHLGKAIALNPKSVVAHNNRGIVRGEMGEYDKAIADFDRALELNPFDSEALANRKKALAENERANVQKAGMKEANPRNPELQAKKDQVLSDVLNYQKDFGDAGVKAISQSEIKTALDDLYIFSERYGDPAQLLREYSRVFHKEFDSFSQFAAYIADGNIPWEIIPKFREIRAELSKTNGTTYSFEKHHLARVDGRNVVFKATFDDERFAFLKMADCREDEFAVKLLKDAGIQNSYGVQNFDGHALIEGINGRSIETILNTGKVLTDKGIVPLTPEMVKGISYEMGRQMASHYVFSITDWNPRNFLVMFKNGKASISRIDFEDFSIRAPNERRFKIEYDQEFFDQAQLDRGFLDGFATIKNNRGRVVNRYETEFEQLVSPVQKAKGYVDLKPPKSILDEVISKIDKRPEEALEEFKSED